MTTPKRARAIWALTNLALVALVPLYAAWIARVSHAPGAPGLNGLTDADSLGVPISQLAFLALVALPIVNLALWRVLRHYPGAVDAFPSVRLDRRHVVVEIGTIVATGALCFIVVDVARAGDWELLPPVLLWLYVALNVRAILHTRVDRHGQSRLRPA